MAKRKRLTPPSSDYLHRLSGPGQGPLPSPAPAASAPRAAPIADVAREASASAALDEVTQKLTEARDEGRMVLALPLAEVELDHLVRDRVVMDKSDMQSLMQSLKTRGQQSPIEVMELGEGRYGLISGWRRCQALSQLHRETGEAKFGEVLALLRRPDQASDAYLAMVEENEIRVGLSFYERARIAVKAVEQGVFASEKAALQGLFANASRAKRSKIGSFTRIVHALDGSLRFPEALTERAGLALSKALDLGQVSAETLQQALAAADPQSGEAEQSCLAAALQEAPTREERPSSETDETRSAAASPVEITPGIFLRSRGADALTLSGPGLTEDFRAELEHWLASRGQ